MIDLPKIEKQWLDVEKQKKTDLKKTTFDVKNYLNLRLDEGQKSKTVAIRILPISAEELKPFELIYTHNVEVNKDLAKGQKPYKSFICVNKTEGVDHEKHGTKCPYCELRTKAYNESVKAQKEGHLEEAKYWQDISISCIPTPSAIFRCIERGKENEGVKFCKVNLRDDKSDIYNQIKGIDEKRIEDAKKRNLTPEDIFDYYTGRDLYIKVTEGSTSAPIVVDDSYPSKLSENEEEMRQWIYDEKRWYDVFTVKPYDYLNVTSQMKVPYFDKQNNRWVDKEEFEAQRDGITSKVNEKIENAEKNIQTLQQNIKEENPFYSNDKVSKLTINNTDRRQELPF